jgi:hypothetical protein
MMPFQPGLKKKTIIIKKMQCEYSKRLFLSKMQCCESGSGFALAGWIWIQIQEGQNDPEKSRKFKVLSATVHVLF